MLDKLLPQVLIIEHKENINISLYNIIERAGFDIIKANTLEKVFSLAITPAIIIIGTQLQEEPAAVIIAIRKVGKFIKNTDNFSILCNRVRFKSGSSGYSYFIFA